MTKLKQYIAKLSITDILATVSIIISLVVLVRDYRRSEQIDQITYTNSAVQFRPKLEIVNYPKIEDNVGYFIKTRQFDSLGTKEVDVLPTGFFIKINLKCVNNGNSFARIINTFCSDTVSGEAELRATLMDKDRRQERMVPASLNGYYKTQELSSGDTINIATELSVASFKDDTFTLHFLILYQNETGALFDTYYWERFKADRIRIVHIDTLIDGKRERTTYPFDPFFNSASRFKFIDSHTSTKLYSSETAKDIIKFIIPEPRRQLISDTILYISWLVALSVLFIANNIPKNSTLFLKSFTNYGNEILKENWRDFLAQSSKLILKIKGHYFRKKKIIAIAKIVVLLMIIPSILILILNGGFTALLEAIGMKDYTGKVDFDFFQSLWIHELSISFLLSIPFFLFSIYITLKIIELAARANSNFKIIFLLFLDFYIALILMEMYQDVQNIYLSSMVYLNSDGTLPNYWFFLGKILRIDLSIRYLFFSLKDMFLGSGSLLFFDICYVLPSLLYLSIITYFIILKLFDKYIFSLTFRLLEVILNINKRIIVTIALIICGILTIVSKWPFG